MGKRALLGIGGAVLLTLGLVLGIIVGPSLQALAAGGRPHTASQATPTAADYCSLYIQTVSQDTGLSPSQLESANQDALQKVIDKMYADGKLTPAQKAQAEQQLAEYAKNPCAAIQAAMKAHGTGATSTGAASSAQAQAVKDARAAIVAAVAGALNITPSALQSELQAGKTVAQITSEHGAKKSAVDAAYLKAAQAQFAKAVSDGSLTQTQSDMAYSLLQQQVSGGHYPLLDANEGSLGSFGSMTPASMPAGMIGG